MRRRFVQRGAELVEVPLDYQSAPDSGLPMIIGDHEAFRSPIDGSVVDGRRQRREHMRRHGVVDYEPSKTGRF